MIRKDHLSRGEKAQGTLRVLRGALPGIEYPIFEGKNYLGRSDLEPVDIDLALQLPANHGWRTNSQAIITCVAGHFVIQPCVGAFVYVNRTRYSATQVLRLHANDIIQIGAVQMRVFFSESSTQLLVLENPLEVPLADIVSDPIRFYGKRVRVIGFLHLAFESNGLYVSREAFEPMTDYRMGLWVDVYKRLHDEDGRFVPVIWEAMENADNLNNEYVLLEGRIDGTDQGHFGLWSGLIGEITLCEIFEPGTAVPAAPVAKG